MEMQMDAEEKDKWNESWLLMPRELRRRTRKITAAEEEAMTTVCK